MFSLLSRIYYINNPPLATPSSNCKPLNFGCLGAANIAPGALVKPARSHPEVVLYAIAARDAGRAEAFAKEHGFQRSYGGPSGYQDMLNDPAVDVIYNPLPNGLHYEWTIKALRAGKHVLLEKPATNTARDARAIYALAEREGLVVLEAFHYRFHPSIQRVKAILDSGELGAIKKVSAALTAPKGTAPEGDIRWSYELGGGSTMDPGSYTINVLRYLAGADPIEVLTAKAVPSSYSPTPTTTPTPLPDSTNPTPLTPSQPQPGKVDRAFWATLSLPNAIIGEVHSDLDEAPLYQCQWPGPLGWGWGLVIPRIPKLSARVECTGGTVEIFNFLVPHYYHSITVTVEKGKGEGKVGRVEKAYSFGGGEKGEDWWSTYRYQLEAFVDKVQGRTPQTWVSAEDTIANMEWVEAIYEKDGFGSRPGSSYTEE